MHHSPIEMLHKAVVGVGWVN